MMQLNHSVLEQIIKDLKKSIALHQDAIGNEECFKNETGNEGCFHCQLEEAIDDLDCLVSHLKPISKNTIHHVQWIDVESFCYSLGKTGQISSIEIKPEWASDSDYRADLSSEQKPIGFTIHVTPTSRMAMDGNGFHVGWESVTYKWKAYSKRELGIAGLPYLLSSWVVNPNEFEIESKDLPDEEEPIHNDDCEFKDDDPDSFDNCDCAEFWNGYYPPDDDFFYQEIQSILESTNWVEAEFNPDTREWTLGYTSFNVNEYQTNQDYADSCNQDDGMPSFGTYC
jgi:hypothetical protein